MKRKQAQIVPAAIRGRYDTGGGIVQRLEIRPDMCTNTLTSVQKDNVLIVIELPSFNNEVRSNEIDDEK